MTTPKANRLLEIIVYRNCHEHVEECADSNNKRECMQLRLWTQLNSSWFSLVQVAIWQQLTLGLIALRSLFYVVKVQHHGPLAPKPPLVTITCRCIWCLGTSMSWPSFAALAFWTLVVAFWVSISHCCMVMNVSKARLDDKWTKTMDAVLRTFSLSATTWCSVWLSQRDSSFLGSRRSPLFHRQINEADLSVWPAAARRTYKTTK